MRAVIIGNGDIKNYDYIKSKLKDDDYIICADGGLKHIGGLGVKPDITLGDFDSHEKPDGVECIVFPVNKDCTDGELAVTYAIDKGFSPILLIAMTGTRLDHTLTNIFQLLKGPEISLIDDNNEIFIIKDTLTIENKKGKTLSIIPICSDMSCVKATGLFYELNGQTLHFGAGKGNSNVITDDFCKISVKDGIGVVIITDGE